MRWGWSARGVITLGVVAVAPLAWALTAEQPRPGSDYAWEPPEVGGAQRVVIGGAAMFVVVVGAFVLARRRSDESFTLRAGGVVLPLAGLSGFAGLFYAVATAPVIGANIGAGLVFLVGLVAIPVSLLVVARSVHRLRAHERFDC